jgi:3-methyladenine DNA glycosylase/8-oxoguanine DNA glycosylase
MNTLEGAVTVRVRASRRGRDASVEAWGAGAAYVLERADALCGADDDPSSFATNGCAVLASLVRRMEGLRFVQLGSAFDLAVSTVIGQRVTTVEARRTWFALVRRFGTPAPGDHGLVVPPTPSVLARLPDWTWRRLGVEERRASTVRRLAGEFARIERAARGPLTEFEARLRAILGVGPWTAAHVTHFVAGDADAVPVGDWHLPSHIAYALAGERRADDARMLELLEPFRPQRARAWRMLAAGTSPPPRRAPRAKIEGLLQAEVRRARSYAG